MIAVSLVVGLTRERSQLGAAHQHMRLGSARVRSRLQIHQFAVVNISQVLRVRRPGKILRRMPDHGPMRINCFHGQRLLGSLRVSKSRTQRKCSSNRNKKCNSPRQDTFLRERRTPQSNHAVSARVLPASSVNHPHSHLASRSLERVWCGHELGNSKRTQPPGPGAPQAGGPPGTQRLQPQGPQDPTACAAPTLHARPGSRAHPAQIRTRCPPRPSATFAALCR